MRTHNILSCERKSKIYHYNASYLALVLKLFSSNNRCLEHIFMVQNLFEPLKFYCSLNMTGLTIKSMGSLSRIISMLCSLE